jgi:hypothetical protein
MQNIAWVTFFRHLPPALLDTLSIKMMSGTEVSIQSILRVDHEFVVLKGRLAGTQDAGRVFFLPYRQIDHLYYQKEVRESEFNDAFDSLQMPIPGTEAAVAAPEGAESPAEAVPTDEVPAFAAEAMPEGTPESTPVNRPTPVPIKSAVLERFRARTISSGSAPSARPSQG